MGAQLTEVQATRPAEALQVPWRPGTQVSYLNLPPRPQLTSPHRPVGILLFLPKEKKVTFSFLESSTWASRDSFKVTFRLFLSPSEK